MRNRGRSPRSFERLSLTREEVRKLIEAARSIRDKLIIAVLYYTGMRTSELSNLRPTDIDTKTGVIRVVRGQSRKSRWVMYPAEDLGALVDSWLEKRKSYTNARNDNHFFVSRIGRKLSPSDVRCIVRKVAKSAGIQVRETPARKPLYGVTPHILRHWFAAMSGGIQRIERRSKRKRRPNTKEKAKRGGKA